MVAAGSRLAQQQWQFEYECRFCFYGQVGFVDLFSGNKLEMGFKDRLDFVDKVLRQNGGGLVAETLEGAIPLKQITGRLKGFHELEAQWTEQARKAGKPFCRTCAFNDFSNNKLKEFEAYQAGMRNVGKTKEEVESNRASPKYGVVIGYSVSFQCPKEHGTSTHYMADEYLALSGKAK